MGMRKIRLTISYDGTEFWGWQRQKRGRTVQGVIEHALQRMHQADVSVVGAGRTDSGVHATGQVAHFLSDIESIPDWRFRDALNYYLPLDVRIVASEVADTEFDARRSACARLYCYNLYCGRVVLPEYRRYCMHLRRTPDLERLNEIVSTLRGVHDFSSFCVRRDGHQNRTRRVHFCRFQICGQFLVLRICANAFLWKMVRNIVGTALEIESQHAGKGEIERILHSRDRALAGATAPASGLFLRRVFYGGE